MKQLLLLAFVLGICGPLRAEPEAGTPNSSVSSAGTDPEVILALEACEGDEGFQWQFAVARFSDLDLYVRHKDDEVWKSVRGGENTFNHDPQHLFRFYRDRIVDEIVDVDKEP